MDEAQKNSLKRNMDELIRLFKKLKDKTVFDNLPGVDKMFIQNFDLLVQNYDEIKEDLSEQLLEQFGAPIHDMIANIVKQLKRELGEDIGSVSSTNISSPKSEQKVLVTPEPSNLNDEIKIIDDLLKQPNLSDEKINRLLDRRSDLTKKLLSGKA